MQIVSELTDSPFDGVMADNDVFDDYYGLDLPIQDAQSMADFRDGVSELVHAASADRSEYSFLPHVEVVRRERVQRSRCLVAGAGVAGLLLAADALLAMNATRQAT